MEEKIKISECGKYVIISYWHPSDNGKICTIEVNKEDLKRIICDKLPEKKG